MVSFADVGRIALALPGTEQRLSRGTRQWRVGEKLFVWERPLRRSDLEALGDRAPTGDVLGVRVADLEMKESLLADDPAVLFTTPHFDGNPCVLARMEALELDELHGLVRDAWRARAPQRLLAQLPR